MAIDQKPAEGRILVARARSTEFFPWYEKAGRITRISGQRVYYKDAKGDEKYLHEYAAVCDTVVEEAALLDFSARKKKVVAELRQELDAQAQRLIDELSPPAATPAKEPAAARRTRSRRPG